MDIQNITLSNKPNASNIEIRASIEKHIPDHDVLLAGFPCQPFSLAGVSKKNSLGKEHGFRCETQGTLFFDIERILQIRRPKFFVLENVKNLKSHDQGNTFAIIIRTLSRLGYWIADISNVDGDIEECISKVKKRRPEPTIIDAKHFLPQHRERIVLIGVRNDLGRENLSLKNLAFPDENSRLRLKDILSDVVDPKYTLSAKLWSYLFKYALKHKAKGNGFGYGLVNPENETAITRTLSARYHKDGSEILINSENLEQEYLIQAKDNPTKYFDPEYKTPRRLTPRECARLMGFEKVELSGESAKKFCIPVSDTRAYRQFGNSVVVPVFRAVAELLHPYILSAKKYEDISSDNTSSGEVMVQLSLDNLFESFPTSCGNQGSISTKIL